MTVHSVPIPFCGLCDKVIIHYLIVYSIVIADAVVGGICTAPSGLQLLVSFDRFSIANS